MTTMSALTGTADVTVTHPRREEAKRRIERALRAEFPHDTVDVSDGYGPNIHVLVVSRRFDAMPEPDRREMLSSLIRTAGLAEDEEGLISLLLAWSPAEIK